MSKKVSGNRFGYAKQGEPASQTMIELSSTSPKPSTGLSSATLTTVPKRSGRMEQAREQLNVRLPTQLKRRALAAAALEGLTVGELIETLLLTYLGEV